ncbi:hypothetical protein D9615_007305 [Tricholomella constricta]|uniref:Uncharacterized protein n=1 Tax=Tricholomella constricta TaxID=117010 RepID=A0A8H5H572_9AGAR|nr:hypothetical protein D9615_007305 [Tricholomella constricta]
MHIDLKTVIDTSALTNFLRDMSLQPPSTRLPPIRKIASQPTEELSDALAYLRHIYIPEIRGARRIKLNDTDASSSSKALDPNGLHELRADAFERSYALRWLTFLVAQAEIWDSESSTTESPQSVLREALIQDAASLLAICSGTAAAGVIVRDFVFRHGPKGEKTSKVHIKDVPLDNRDYGSVGAQTWGGACVLAETILDDPTRFGLLRNDSSAENLRILELGAGTGLVSLTVGKLLQNAAPSATIIATDYYPSVLENLESNIRHNFPSPLGSKAVRISSHLLDWSVFAKDPAQNPPFDAPFDLVLGADIIYEAQHAIWIKSCLMTLLKKPSQHSDPLFHLIIPLRSTHSSESGTVDSVFSHMSGDAASGSEMDLKIVDKEIILCDAGSGLGPDQIEYACYKIGWR